MNTFKDFQPINLTYQEISSCELNSYTLTLNNGLQVLMYDILKDVKDVNLNNDTCLVLTDKKQIGNIFVYKKNKTEIGYTPVDIKLQPVQLQQGYINYNVKSDTFKCDNEFVALNITRTKNDDNSVYLMYENKYVSVEKTYPYHVRLKSKSEVYYLDNDQYTFYINEIGEYFSFKVTLDNISRYIGLGYNNTLTATGMYLGDAFNFHYLFKVEILSTKSVVFNPIVSNKWVTYHMNLNDRANNNNVEINKTLTTTNNYLLNLNINQTVKDKTANLNIANLKTNFTPVGVGTSINNLEVNELSVLSIVNERNICINTPSGVLAFNSSKIQISN